MYHIHELLIDSNTTLLNMNLNATNQYIKLIHSTMLSHYFATEDDIKCKINSYYVHAGSEQQSLFQLQAAVI